MNWIIVSQHELCYYIVYWCKSVWDTRKSGFSLSKSDLILFVCKQFLQGVG